MSPDEIGVGRRSLILVRHGTGYHLIVLLPHNVSSPLCSSVLKPYLYMYERRRNAHVIIPTFYNNIFNIIPTCPSCLTCSTRLDSPVFWASCFKSLASGFWLMLKYDFIVRSWWCLNDVRMRFVRVCWCCCCDMLPVVPIVEEFVGDDKLDVS